MKCPVCMGSGKVQTRVWPDDDLELETCDECVGTGEIKAELCDECGYHKIDESLEWVGNLSQGFNGVFEEVRKMNDLKN